MYSTSKIIRTISFMGALVLAATTARAVDPPPDGGYPRGTTAEGKDALFSLTTGVFNTAVGFNALYNNTKGPSNTALGFTALRENTIGQANTAVGVQALLNNTTGNSNTAVGLGALLGTGAGHDNTAIGFSAGTNVSGNNNIIIGSSAGQLVQGVLSDNIVIGSQGNFGDTGTVRVGTAGVQSKAFIAGISGATVAGGVTVVVDANGQLGTLTSSGRYKDSIQPMDKASEAILSLKPVTFHYKKELDPKGIPQFGLVAEQVAKVSPDLVARDDQGKPYTVRYEAVNAMLLNEFIKEHRQMTELKTTVAEQQRQISTLTAAFEKQARQIQQVSAQLETSRSAPRLVAEE